MDLYLNRGEEPKCPRKTTEVKKSEIEITTEVKTSPSYSLKLAINLDSDENTLAVLTKSVTDCQTSY